MVRSVLMRAAACTGALYMAISAGAVGGGLGSDSSPKPPELRVSVASSPAPLVAPGRGSLQVSISIPKGYHIFGGTRLGVRVEGAPAGSTFGSARFSKGVMEKDPELDETFEVHRGTVTAQIPATLGAGTAGPLRGNLLLDWQGCQDFGDRVCFMPTADKVPFEVAVTKGSADQGETEPGATPDTPASEPVPGPESASPGLPEGFAEAGRFVGFRSPDGFLKWTAESLGGQGTSGGLEALFGRAARENVPFALIMAFLFGVLSSLTPCVYPVIPITVAYIGSRSEGQGRKRSLALSLVFVLGMALVYSVLGAVSARAGAAFGSLTQTPWVGLPLAALFYALALSMFNLFEFKTPGFLATKIEQTKQRGKGKGYVGAFFIGALSGLVASPCIGPLILAILVVVAATGSALLGFLYLFAFALGLGVLFVVIGTFSGILASLPKSGSWMDGVRIFFGVLILAASFYFASLYLSRRLFFVLGAAALLGVLLFLLLGARRHFFPIPVRTAGGLLSAVAFALVILTLPGSGPAKNGVPWRADLASAAEEARESGKPMLLDFRADWCVACVELEKKTWPESKVQAFLKGVVPVKLDMTTQGEREKAILEAFGVKGLPTVILLTPEEATP